MSGGFFGLGGFARRDVTPPVGIRNRNWGAATSDRATGVHRPLEVSSLVLADEDRTERLVLVTWDTCTWKRSDEWKPFQQQVLDRLGLRPEQLIVNLSHTHSGVHACWASADLPGGEGLPAHLDAVTEAVVDASLEALAALRPVTIDWTEGHSEVAANRDLVVAGSALTGWNPEGAADPTVLIGRITSGGEEPVATIVNYACHGTTLGPGNLLLSPDYVGALRETVEDATGAPVVFLQGASGDTAPREQYSDDPALADRHGRAIGYAVLSALEGMPPPGTELAMTAIVESGAPLAYWTPVPTARASVLATSEHVVELPLRSLPSIAELEAEWADILPQSREERLRRVRNLREGYVDLDERPESVDHRLWVARIGDALLVAHHGESYHWFQVELRRRFPGVPLLVLGNSNGGGHVYLPGRPAYEHHAYQAWQTVLAPGSLELLADAATAALDAIAPPVAPPQTTERRTP